MSIFTRLVEKRALAYVLSNYENGPEEFFLGQSFNRSNSGLYKVPYDKAKEVTVGAVLEEKNFSFRRSLFLEFFGLGTRVYVMDQFPAVSFGKPVAALVFRNFKRQPLFVLETQSKVTINGDTFRFSDIAFLNNNSINPFQLPLEPGPELPEEESPDTDFVFDEAFLENVDEEGNPDEPILLQNNGPLMPDFPPDDLPNPSKPVFPFVDKDEGGPAYVRPPRKAVYLFYGLCFEERRNARGGNKGYNPDSRFQADVYALKDEFSNRGYRSRVGLAGKKAPNGGKADNFAQMMNGLAADIALNTAYCKSSQDQLVIFINGHGFTPASSKTGNMAIHYDTELMTVTNKKPEFIPFSTLFKTLAAIKQIGADPKKVYLIIDSCRCARSLRGGIPASLAGMHLILSDDRLENCYKGEMAVAIRDYVMSGGKSWKGLVIASKYLPKLKKERLKEDVGLTYNTDVKGCAVSVKLDMLKYQGQDVGNGFGFDIKTDSSTSFLFEGKKTSATIKNKAKSFKTGVLKPSNSFKWGSLVYGEVFWPPCDKDNKPDISYEINTTINGLANPVKAKGKFIVNCDTAKTTAQIVKVEVTKGQNKATLELSFAIKVRCVK